MNLQRREEIRAISASLRMMPLNEAAGAIDELLAHIDTLEQTAAERVIARGSKIKPHTFAETVNAVRDIASQYAGTEQLRERIAYELGRHFVLDGGPTPDYTGEGSAWVPPKCQPIPTSGQREKDVWNDGFAHGWKAGFNDDERKPVGAPAVVVPELPTWEDGENKLRRGEKLTALEKFVMDHDWHKTDTTFRDGLEAVFAELRANQGGAAT